MEWQDPDKLTKKTTADVKSELLSLSDFLIEQGRPGYVDKINQAINRLDNLTEGYLSACKENDKLRKKLSGQDKQQDLL